MRKIFLLAVWASTMLSAAAAWAQVATKNVQTSALRWGLDSVPVVGPCPTTGGPSGGTSFSITDETGASIGDNVLSCNGNAMLVGISYRLLLPGAHVLTDNYCSYGGIVPTPVTCTHGTPAPVAVSLAGTPIAELATSVTVVNVYANPAYKACQGSARYVPPGTATFPPPPGMSSPQYIEVTSTCAGTVGLELPFAPANGDIWVYDLVSGWRSITTADPEAGFYGSFAVVPVGRHGWIAFSHPIASQASAVTPRTGLWWGGQSQSGWGLQVSSHASNAGDRLFVAAYIYDSNGNPMWVVMPSGSWDASHTTWSGDLYSPHGAPFSSYDATRYSPGTSLGTGQLKFSASGSAAFSYPSGGDRAIQFYEFAADSSPGTYQGLWWAGPAQNGWGLSIAEQGGTLFATWYTYDASGNPVWYFMPGATRITDAHYTGALYRTTGGPWPSQVPYVGSMTKVFPVGTLDLQFSNADAATMNATVDGKAVTIPISRFDF